MIPGVNATDEHLKRIAALHQKYPDLEGIELMPYHKMGVEKGIRVGITPTVNHLDDTNEQIQKNWLDRLRSLGCSKAVIG
jgi:pyruvate formate lyase activating enzyme